MLLTPHLLSGMLLGSSSENIFISACLGFLSYFILEMIPHWDPENVKRKSVFFIRIADIWVGVLAYFTIIATKGLEKGYVIGGIFAAIPYFFFYFSALFSHKYAFLEKMHKTRKFIKYIDRTGWGILIQASICIIAVVLMYNLIPFPTWDKVRLQFGF